MAGAQPLGGANPANIEALYAAGELSPEEYQAWKAKMTQQQQPQPKLGDLIQPTVQPEPQGGTPGGDSADIMDAAKLILTMMQGG